MQPIATDTILQQRYRLIKLIGEGGFGRTYLARDQSRFNESCAIKELSLASRSRSHLSKAKEFFKQEAALLYQLQHPQIPRFWATFEERDRLFLVQDYVPGSTYEDLLHERTQHHQAFTEAEVWRFLLQVLPVLGYIHSHGVIHQDISPDNIILRETDMLPVLIDFGVVKQLASRLQREVTEEVAANVGKPGYAPIEQLHNGQAYPNSDLYSLAVTALVLLTGRSATELFGSNMQINWVWRNWVNVSDGLANVLGKMLNYQPSERYQSAVEVFQALQSLSIPIDQIGSAQPASVSQIHNVMLPNEGSRPTRAQRMASRVRTALSQLDVKSMWEQPRVYIPLFFAMAFISFAAGLTAMTLWQRQNETPAVVPGPTLAGGAIVSPSSVASDIKPPRAISLVGGETTVQSGQIATDQKVDYEFYGTQGQEVLVAIDNPKLLFTVLGPNGSAVDAQAIRVPKWQGKIMVTGKHIIQIKSLPDAQGGPFDYRLSGSLNPIAANPQPTVITPSVSSTEANTPQPEVPLTIPTGTTPLPVPITIPSGQADRPPRSSQRPASRRVAPDTSNESPPVSASPSPTLVEPSSSDIPSASPSSEFTTPNRFEPSPSTLTPTPSASP